MAKSSLGHRAAHHHPSRCKGGMKQPGLDQLLVSVASHWLLDFPAFGIAIGAVGPAVW